MMDNTTNATGNDDPQTAAPETVADTTALSVDETDALRRRLYLQMGLAVALILALLGGLALMDEMNAPAPKPETPLAQASSSSTTSTHTPSAPSSPDATAQTQVPPLTPGSESLAVTADAAQESSAAPSTPDQMESEIHSDPETSRLRPLTQPATARLAAIPPSETGRIVKPSPLSRGEPAAELARQAHAGHANAAPSPALTPPTPSTSSASQASRPLSRPGIHTLASGGGYLLQLGVFSSTTNAEELRATLELNGIPAQVESRVQVGPFASRAEAEQMRERLKKLGLHDGVLVTVRK